MWLCCFIIIYICENSILPGTSCSSLHLRHGKVTCPFHVLSVPPLNVFRCLVCIIMDFLLEVPVEMGLMNYQIGYFT